MSQQLVSIKSEAGPTFIRLVQVHTLISSHYELGVLGRVRQTGAAQGTSMRVQFHFRILFDGQCVALMKEGGGQTFNADGWRDERVHLHGPKKPADLHRPSPGWLQTDV